RRAVPRRLPRRGGLRHHVARDLRERRVPPGHAAPDRRGGRPVVRTRPRHVRRGQGPPPRHTRRPGRRPHPHPCAAAPHRALPARRPALRPTGSAMTDEPVILLLSASDTDLMAARASGGPYRLANPARTDPVAVQGLLNGAFCVIVRLLGGRRSWPGGL